MTEPIKERLKQLLSEGQELADKGGPEGTAPILTSVRSLPSALCSVRLRPDQRPDHRLQLHESLP